MKEPWLRKGIIIRGGVEGKKCGACEEWKALIAYYPQKTGRGGVRSKCKPCFDAYTNEYHAKNRENVNAKAKENRLNDPEGYKNRRDSWRSRNKDKILERQRIYQANRKQNDPAFKMLHRLRCRVCDCISKNVRSATTKELLGCSPEFFKEYLEDMFQEGMSWDNYGQGKGCWHIDHVDPCSSFDMNNPYDQKECFHYKNMQPLWAEDNWKKGST
jgi:hypothetical protein